MNTPTDPEQPRIPLPFPPTPKPFNLARTLRNAPRGAVLWTSTIDRTVTGALVQAKRRGATKRFLAIAPDGGEVFKLVRVTML